MDRALFVGTIAIFIRHLPLSCVAVCLFPFNEFVSRIYNEIQ